MLVEVSDIVKTYLDRHVGDGKLRIGQILHGVFDAHGVDIFDRGVIGHLLELAAEIGGGEACHGGELRHLQLGVVFFVDVLENIQNGAAKLADRDGGRMGADGIAADQLGKQHEQIADRGYTGDLGRGIPVPQNGIRKREDALVRDQILNDDRIVGQGEKSLVERGKILADKNVRVQKNAVIVGMILRFRLVGVIGVEKQDVVFLALRVRPLQMQRREPERTTRISMIL